MKELKEMTLCVAPFIVSAVLVYPFMAIVGADFDPFMWERHDRMFYFICTVTFGCMRCSAECAVCVRSRCDGLGLSKHRIDLPLDGRGCCYLHWYRLRLSCGDGIFRNLLL